MRSRLVGLLEVITDQPIPGRAVSEGDGAARTSMNRGAFPGADGNASLNSDRVRRIPGRRSMR